MSAVCYRRLGEYEEAIEYCKIIVDNWPGYRRAWHAQFIIGRCYEKLKQEGHMLTLEANVNIKEAYEKLLQNYPDCGVARIAQNWLNRADNN